MTSFCGFITYGSGFCGMKSISEVQISEIEISGKEFEDVKTTT
jgi:hypothetical protein